MIEIEQGKVYRLISGGLFVAESRHEHPDEPENNHWLMRRITMVNGWDGYHDPLIFDCAPEREWLVVREANNEDYLEYEDQYSVAYEKLMEEASEYDDVINELEYWRHNA